MAGVREKFKDELKQTVQEYLDKEEYTAYGVRGFRWSSPGEDRAKAYLDKIQGCQTDVFQKAVDDFFSTEANAELGTSKVLRRRIGEAICQQLNIKIKDKYIEELSYPRKPTDEAKISIMRREIDESLKVEKSKALKERILAGLKSSQSDEKKSDSAKLLSDAVLKADRVFFEKNQLDDKDLKNLIERILQGVSAGEIAESRQVIDTIKQDFEARVVKDIISKGLADKFIAEDSAPLNALINNIGLSYYALDENIRNAHLDISALAIELTDCDTLISTVSGKRLKPRS